MNRALALLASVKDAHEARLALGAGARIIDAKDPAVGALGALPAATVRDIVTAVAGRAPVSATAGDHPDMAARTIEPAIARLAACGVDFVKLGLFPAPALQACLAALAPLARAHALVGVFFADRWTDYEALGGVPALVGRLAAAGFRGALLDTADKHSGSLLAHGDAARLGAFIAAARAAGLRCGLAGSLRALDVPRLLPLAPDLLGFRGALCADHARGGALDPARVRGLARMLATAGAETPAGRAG